MAEPKSESGENEKASPDMWLNSQIRSHLNFDENGRLKSHNDSQAIGWSKWADEQMEFYLQFNPEGRTLAHVQLVDELSRSIHLSRVYPLIITAVLAGVGIGILAYRLFL